MGEEASVVKVVSSPEDLILNRRELAIKNRLRENSASRSRYLEHLELSLGNGRCLRTIPEAVMDDVAGDGNCAYRAVILDLKHVEISVRQRRCSWRGPFYDKQRIGYHDAGSHWCGVGHRWRA